MPETEDETITKTNRKILNITNQLVKDYTIKTMIDNEEMWLYQTDGGYYTPTGQGWIKTYCSNDNHAEVNDKMHHIIKNVGGRTMMFRDDFVPPDLHINLANGVLDIVKMELLPHNNKYNFKGRTEIIYNRDAKCPKFLDFINWALPNHNDIDLLQEWYGYHFIRKQPYKKALMVYGVPNSGKTTIIMKTLQDIIGKSNISANSLQSLSDPVQHALDSMYGKIANIDADMGGNVVDDVAMFKKIVGSDLIKANPKFMHPFEYYPDAKLSFGCNNLPWLKAAVDNDEAFWNRWLLLELTKRIDNRDPMFYEKNIAPELSGILNWAITGLWRLVKNGHFTYDDDSTYDRWQTAIIEGNVLFPFYSDCISQSPGESVNKDITYNFYKDYIELMNGLHNTKNKPIGITKFGIEFHKLAPHGQKTIRKEDGSWKNIRTWDGIILNTNFIKNIKIIKNL